jgi:phosphoserine aminotransferase
MSKIHNFSAGPSILPQEAIQACVEGIQNFAGTGLSLLEVSHRGKEFVKVVEDTQAIIKELMDIPDGYEILFLGGGASMQFITGCI